MKTIHLFRFNDSFFRKIPFFKEEHKLKTDVTEIDMMDIKIVTEYIVKTHDDFSFDNTSSPVLSKFSFRICLCSALIFSSNSTVPKSTTAFLMPNLSSS